MIYRLSEVRRRGFDIEGPILFSFILSDKKNLGLIIIDYQNFYRKRPALQLTMQKDNFVQAILCGCGRKRSSFYMNC
jgi:hypothetical protein